MIENKTSVLIKLEIFDSSNQNKLLKSNKKAKLQNKDLSKTPTPKNLLRKINQFDLRSNKFQKSFSNLPKKSSSLE